MRKLSQTGKQKLYNYVLNEYGQEAVDKYQHILLSPQKASGISYFNDKEYARAQLAEKRSARLYEQLVGNEVSETAIELCAFEYTEKRVSILLKDLTGIDRVTLELAAKITYGDKCFTDFMPTIEVSYQFLRTILISEENSSDILRQPLSIDQRLASWLSGLDRLPVDLNNFVKCRKVQQEPPIVYGYKKRLEAFTNEVLSICTTYKYIEATTSLAVVLSGEKDCGRYTCAAYIAEALKMPLISVEYELLLYDKTPRSTIRRLVRECFFENGVLCIHGICKDKSNTFNLLIKEVEREYKYLSFRPLFLACDPDVKPVPVLSGMYLGFDIKKTSPQESFELWNGYLGEAFSEKINKVMNSSETEKTQLSINIHEIASKMLLNAGQIKRISELLFARVISGNTDEPVNDKLLYKLCYRVLDDGRYENVKRVESGFTLDDLKIPKDKKAILTDICNQMIYREFVYSTWNLCSKYTYGRCLSALFAGPPGTGKTMAVHAIANELGLELYKVDLSQIVDKYIGETEKRLEEVFTTAQKSNMILFFDEADAVLGKRTETTDAKDKYANTEISYILQRMEEFDGIVIMATNFIQNIDIAFMRRIRYVVSFDMPDEALRKEIWMNSFPKEVPLSPDIDWDYLAGNFEIAGGNIKNIVLNAIFYAAPKRENVSMAHIIKAIVRENSKDKKLSFISALGPYAALARNVLEEN